MQFRKVLPIPKYNAEMIWLVFITTTIGGRNYDGEGRDGYPAHSADAIIWLFGAFRGFLR